MESIYKKVYMSLSADMETLSDQVEVLETKDPIRMLAGMLIDGGPERMEKAIRNTYTKDEAEKIIEALNILLEVGGVK